MRPFVNYFFRGMLFVFPVFATLYIILILVNWADNLFNNLLFDWIESDIPGLGLITAISLIILLGYLITQAFYKPYFNFLERMMIRTPFIKIIYTAFKDLTEAFVGEQKKFNKPVIATLAEGVDRIGFVTEDNLENIGISDRVAVYCPHSYNFSGNLFLVDPKRVRKLDVNPADAMKFAVSAGVTNIQLEPETGDIQTV